MRMTFSAAPPCAGPDSAAIARGDRGVQVGIGARDHARGERRGVRAVLRMQDHVEVHESRGVARWALALQHVKEVRRMAERPVRRDRLAAVANMLVRGDYHRHLRRQPHALAQRAVGPICRRPRDRTRRAPIPRCAAHPSDAPPCTVRIMSSICARQRARGFELARRTRPSSARDGSSPCSSR